MTFGPILIQELGRCRTHIGERIFYYKNQYDNWPCFKALLPKKQDFTGWLSPDGFLFACPYCAVAPTPYPHNYEEAAREIGLAVGCEDAGHNKNAPALQSDGWVFLVNNELHLSQAWTLNDVQVQVQESLKGVDL